MFCIFRFMWIEDTREKRVKLRVSNYKDRLNAWKYKPEDMPMGINKIIHCEKRNELRINVYGLEGKT